MAKDDFFSRYYLSGKDQNWPFSPVSLGYNRYAAHDMFPHGNHPASRIGTTRHGRVLETITLVHVARGRGHFWSEAIPRTTIPANTILFVHPGLRHFYRFEEDTGWDNEWLELKPEDALPLMKAVGITPADPFRTFPAAAGVARRFRELFDVAVSEPGGGGVRLASRAYCVLAEALALWRHGGHSSRSAEQVEKMRELLESDLVNATTVEAASHLCGMSTSRMRLLFSQSFGLSPKQYQLRARIRRAQELLMESSMSVTEIAEAAGFDSINAFSRQFRRMTGYSPRTWRLSDA